MRAQMLSLGALKARSTGTMRDGRQTRLGVAIAKMKCGAWLAATRQRQACSAAGESVETPGVHPRVFTDRHRTEKTFPFFSPSFLLLFGRHHENRQISRFIIDFSF